MSNPELEDAIWSTLAEEERRRQSIAQTATPETATRVGQIHSQYPSLPAGVKLAAAKANLTDEQVKQIALKATPVSQQVKTKPKKSWFERNVMDKVKTASRYTFAGLEFAPQFVQGGIGQLFDNNKDINGWMISTDLGSLIANDEEAGTGFFIGGRAKELQSERARRYRGEINGEAFTIGRGLASTFLEPNTIQYRLLSGAVDAAAAIGTPSAPLVKDIGKGARILEEGGTIAGQGLGLVGKGLTAVSKTEKGEAAIERIAEVSRVVGKGSKEVGLTKLNAAQRQALRDEVGLIGESVDLEKANRFFTTGFGRRIVERTAQTNDFAETHALWGGKLDPATTMKLAQAKTEPEVMAALLDTLGTEVTNIADIKGGRRAYRSLAQRNAMIKALPLGEGFSRAFAKMPTYSINLSQAETPRDQILQIETVDRALKLYKADPDKRTEFINRAGELILSKDEAKIKKFYDDMDEQLKQSMVRNGTARELIDSLYTKIKEYTDTNKLFTADSNGHRYDDGLYRKMNGLPEEADARAYLGTLTSEFGKNEYFIPDPKQVRRLTNQYNWLWVKKDPNISKLEGAGELRFPASAAEAFQEKVWRKYITATIGNFTRNTVDSQISIALSGKAGPASPFIHPFQWMSFVGHKVGKGTLSGKDWDAIGSVENLGDELLDYRAALGDLVSSYYKDPLAARRRAMRIGQFDRVDRRLDMVDPKVVRYHGDELGKLNADWSTRTLAQGKSTEEIFNLIQEGKDEDAMKWFNSVKSKFASGVEVWDAAQRNITYQKIDLTVPGNLQRLLEANSARVQRITGSHPELLDVVGQGRLTKKIEIAGEGDEITGQLRVGGRVQVTRTRKVKGGTQQETFIGNVVDVQGTGKKATYQIEPFAFDGMGDNTTQLESLLSANDIYMNDKMPRYVVGEIRNPNTPAQNQILKSMDRMVEGFHAYLYTKPIAVLERSPAFRSIYYDWIDKLAISLDKDSLNKIIDDISSRVEDPQNYLTPKLWDKLLDLQANPNKLYGTLNADEVSGFASASALDEYKKTFYNAVERRNGTDVLRLISPFAQQQAEFLGRMARFFTVPVAGGSLGYLPNTQNLRKMQLIVEGGRDADPDGDGRGFFHKDAVSGLQSFSFPLTGGLTKMFTGVDAQLTAPIKGLSPGFDFRPGLGPVFTIATSKILADVPATDWIRKIVLSHGEQNQLSGAFTPTWVQKIVDGVSGQTNGRFFANTYAETMQALAATGKYDLANTDERDRLMQDAKDKARLLVVLRGISQFTGPASGDYDIKTPTKAGDIHTNGLALALRSLQENNYDTAALRFIEIFGEDAFTYLSNKTTSEAGGLDASKAFGDFERTNQDLFRKYKDVAGFFGPTSTEFDFEVYTRQLQTGKRRRLTPDEMLKASERAIGLAYYRDMKEHLGTKLNQAQRDYLAKYKRDIIAKYPGFGEMNYDPTKTQRDIDSLFEAAKSEKLQDNGVAQAVQYYEKIRNAALAEANNRGYRTLKSADLADLHQYLSSYADVLIQETPDFAKVYDRLLSQEID